jgi:hypothetical protein
MIGARGQLVDACFLDGDRLVARTVSALYAIDAMSGSVLETVPVAQPVEQLAASRDGAVVACVTAPGTLSIARGRLADLHDAISDGRTFRHVALSTSGTRVIAAYRDAAAIVDLDDASTLADLCGHYSDVTAVAISGDGTVALTGSSDETAIVWDVASGRPRHVLGSHTRSVRRVAIDEAARTIATIDSMLVLRTWDAGSGRCLLVHAFAGRHVLALAFGPRGSCLWVLLSGGALVQFQRYERDGIVWWQPIRSLAGVARNEDGATLSIDAAGSRAVVAGPLAAVEPDAWSRIANLCLVDLASGVSRDVRAGAESPVA